MMHYAIDQWADFTRGLSAGEQYSQMAAHQSDCRKCRHLSDFTARLTVTCTNLTANPVPESTVRLARAIFPVRASGRPPRGSRLPIEMIFDSFLAPSPVGVRASRQVGWQGLYRAGECSVDLRIEPELHSSRAAVIGQVTNHLLPDVQMGNLPVSLRAGKLVVAETLSNAFGEFQLEYDQQAQLQLCIDLRDARSIQVPLKRFIPDPPAVKSRTSLRKPAADQQ